MIECLLKHLAYVPCLILFMLIVILILYLISVPSVYSFVLGLELSYPNNRGGGAVGAHSAPLANSL